MPEARPACAAAVAALAAWSLGVGEASGYEFEVRSRTIGQGHALRSIRLLGDDVTLSRRRFTHILSLNIWDLADRLERLELHDPPPRSGPNLYVSSYLRVDHDFGSFVTGSLRVDDRIVHAVDAIPELEHGSLQLDVLFAYAAAEGLAGGWLDVYFGRQLEIDTLDWFSMDGLEVRAETPWKVAVEAFGGLRVRASSPLGVPEQEPDGTEGAACQEYVEGSIPGSGSWRPIDRQLPGGDDPFASDFDFCPQREQPMPTFGAAIESEGIAWLHARVAYRRSVSQSPGLIGAVDRFDEPDVGYYPNEVGQAPGWGVNEERLSATVRAPLRFAEGRVQLDPYAGARYSVLHGLVDEAHLGTCFRWGAHAVQPEVFYSFPTFDGDSIFNVFSTDPYTDVRLTYDLAPAMSPWSGYVRGWTRRFTTEDADQAMPTEDVHAQELAAGVHLGGRYFRARDALLRVDGFYEDGYGGRRVGGYASARWQTTSRLALGLRLSLVDFAEDSLANLDGLTFGTQAGATYLINDGVALTALVEENVNRFHRSQLSMFGILDMAFNPET